MASTIFLQHSDGSVESIPVLSQQSARKIVLGSAPRLPLVTGYNSKTKFLVRGTTAVRRFPLKFPIKFISTTADVLGFLVMEREPVDDERRNFIHRIKAIDYNPLYYANDRDIPSEETRSPH